VAIIEIESLSFTYPNGTKALASVDMDIEANQSIAIAGQNGAGKSTLIKVIMGLLKPTTGSVRLFGESTTATTTAKIARRVGFVFQNPRMQIFLGSVLAEVRFGPLRLGMDEGTVQQRVREALQITGLDGREETHPYDLNPAERKLLTIASAISMNPQVLILDEPTGGMDFAGVERVVDVIRAFLADGRTVIIVTHDMDLAARCASRMVVMNQGSILADAETRQIFSQHSLLESAHLEPTAISQLAAACGLPPTLLTVPEMVVYLTGK
jgi:energy-coupling factor transport system ATP-binding protein